MCDEAISSSIKEIASLGSARNDADWPVTLLYLQPITHARLCKQVTWARRIDFDLAAQLAHVHAQVMAFCRISRPPHLFQQLRLRHHFARMLHQRFEEIVLDRSEMHFFVGNRHLSPREIDFQIAYFQDRFFTRISGLLRVTQRHAHAR